MEQGDILCQRHVEQGDFWLTTGGCGPNMILQVCAGSCLQENPHVRVDETVDATEERTEEPANNGEIRVWGNLVAFVERLDDELFKSLQVCVCQCSVVFSCDIECECVPDFVGSY